MIQEVGLLGFKDGTFRGHTAGGTWGLSICRVMKHKTNPPVTQEVTGSPGCRPWTHIRVPNKARQGSRSAGDSDLGLRDPTPPRSSLNFQCMREGVTGWGGCPCWSLPYTLGNAVALHPGSRCESGMTACSTSVLWLEGKRK